MHNFNFKLWIEEIVNKTKIVIDYSDIDKFLLEEKERLLDYKHSKEELLRTFNPIQFIEYIKKELKEYPRLEIFVQNLIRKNNQKIINEIGPIRDWLTTNNKELMLRRMLTRKIYDYIDFVNKDKAITDEEIEEHLNSIKLHFQKLSNKIKQFLENKISQIKDWTSPLVTIKPSYSDQKDNHHNFLIEINNSPENLYFSLFLTTNNESIEVADIDDILDAGDDEFFNDPNKEKDYFSLINVLLNKNNNKTLTLYTARPKKDRSFYANTTYLPKNIFLTNKQDHAEGLAFDLSNSDETRDVWIVKISQNNLVQTLNGPVNYYQTINEKNPVLSINLVN